MKEIHDNRPRCKDRCRCTAPCFMIAGHMGSCSCFYMGCGKPTDDKKEIFVEEKKEEPLVRPSWHETWMSIAHTIAARSYDPRMKVGAIVISEDNSSMLGCGYNGNYAGGPNIPESNEPGMTGFIHAEINALLKCPYHYPMKKVMYVTVMPCAGCAKCVINGGISKVIYDADYRNRAGVEILAAAGITVVKYSDLVNGS
jgi:dCMP deaminase